MTNNDAKDYLTALWGSDDISIDETIALEMAIKALEQQPCEDCISREAVHDLMAMLLSDYLHDEDREKIELIDAKIAELPSVTPEEKTGKWINVHDNIGECSCCGINKMHVWYNFCPNCGADMRGDTDGKDSN